MTINKTRLSATGSMTLTLLLGIVALPPVAHAWQDAPVTNATFGRGIGGTQGRRHAIGGGQIRGQGTRGFGGRSFGLH